MVWGNLIPVVASTFGVLTTGYYLSGFQPEKPW